MTACARVVILAAIAGCHRTPSARERVLSRLPGASAVLVAADGPVLADPSFRRVLDGARPRLPASFGCVLDAALSSQAVGLSGDRTGIAVAIVTRASVQRCPALSKIATDVWVATVGEPVLPAAGDLTALTDPTWQRARDYLLHAPMAFAARRGQASLLGTATVDPVEAWLAIEAPEVISIRLEQAIGAFLQQQPDVAKKIATRRSANQLVFTAKDFGSRDVETLSRAVMALFDAPPEPAPARIGCPDTFDDSVRACTPGPKLAVKSVRETITAMTNARREPVIVNGDVVGLRLTEATPFLHKGDVIVAVDSRRVRSDAELATLIQQKRTRATLIVRRGTEDNVIELEE